MAVTATIQTRQIRSRLSSIGPACELMTRMAMTALPTRIHNLNKLIRSFRYRRRGASCTCEMFGDRMIAADTDFAPVRF